MLAGAGQGAETYMRLRLASMLRLVVDLLAGFAAGPHGADWRLDTVAVRGTCTAWHKRAGL